MCLIVQPLNYYSIRIDTTAQVHPSVKIEPNVTIRAKAKVRSLDFCLSHKQIMENCTIGSNSDIGEGVEIGKETYLHLTYIILILKALLGDLSSSQTVKLDLMFILNTLLRLDRFIPVNYHTHLRFRMDLDGTLQMKGIFTQRNHN